MTRHRVYRSLNRPLTICGVERRLFFAALVVGAAVFNFFGSFVGGVVMFGALFAGARSITRHDPELIRILVNSGQFRASYDPAKADLPVLLTQRRIR